MNTIYEPQRNADGRRRCGAAALLMVYRSFSPETTRFSDSYHPAAQERIFEELGRSERTFRLADHAIGNGLAAVVVRLRRPWEGMLTFFASCPDGRAILNIRAAPDSHRGHFVYVHAMQPEENAIILHDPQCGPHRRLRREELIELWTPLPPCEMRGRIGVFFRPRPDSSARLCDHCGIPLELDGFQAFLASAEYLFCPGCDHPHPLSGMFFRG